ncbi:hypothetical protein Tco_0545188 [Tanacetum coccineum]
MAALRYRDEHNKVGYLQKPKGSDDYHQILDFLGASHIRYALTIDPIIFDSLVKQFWSTATLRSPELGPPAILATIDATPYTITEDSVRGQLQLADDGGIDDLPIADIYSGMDNLGYVTEGKLTFYKNKFSPQWRRKFNWSSYNFKGMSLSMVKVQTQILLPFHKSKRLDCPSTLLKCAKDVPLGGLSMPLHKSFSLVQKVHSLETKLKAHKQLFKDVVGKLVKQIKAMEVKLKTKKRKVVVSDSDNEDGGEQNVDLDALHALANAAVTVDSTKSPGCASSNPAACYDVPTSDVPTSDVPTTDVPTHVSSGVAPTGPSTISLGSTTVPTSSSIPTAEPIPAMSGTTTATPVSLVRDARKGKGISVEEPTPTQDKTFKQLEEERLPKKEIAQDLSSTIFGVDSTNDDFEAKMVALVNSRRKELAEQRAQEREVYAMTTMLSSGSIYKNFCEESSPAVFSLLVTYGQVRKLSPEQLQEEFDKIQRVVAFTRGLKRDGSPMTTAFSKKLKTSDVEVDVEAPSHEAQVEVPSQEASVEDVEVPSNITSKAQQTASSLKKVGTKKKILAKKVYASDEDLLLIVFTTCSIIASLGNPSLGTRSDLLLIYGADDVFIKIRKAEGGWLVLWVRSLDFDGFKLSE